MRVATSLDRPPSKECSTGFSPVRNTLPTDLPIYGRWKQKPKQHDNQYDIWGKCPNGDSDQHRINSPAAVSEELGCGAILGPRQGISGVRTLRRLVQPSAGIHLWKSPRGTDSAAGCPTVAC